MDNEHGNQKLMPTRPPRSKEQSSSRSLNQQSEYLRSSPAARHGRSNVRFALTGSSSDEEAPTPTGAIDKKSEASATAAASRERSTTSQFSVALHEHVLNPELIEEPPEPLPPHLKNEKLTVFILCVINFINYMDRYTLAGVLDQVMKSFEIHDDETGLISTVFLISYMVFAPVFGYIGDRKSRKLILTIGVGVWSVSGLIGSFETSFPRFLFWRALVGAGEASFCTIAPTILGDMFVGSTRSKVLAAFYFAIPVGCGLGYVIGSCAVKVGGYWGYSLRVTPWISFAMIILMVLFLVEPPRGDSQRLYLKVTAWKSDIVYLAKNRSFVYSTLGFTCVSFAAGALAWWGPHFIHLGFMNQGSTEPMSKNEVAYIFGAITILAGLIGVPAGSFLSHTARKETLRVDPLICGSGLILSTPFIFLAAVLSKRDTTGCFIAIFFGQLFLNLNWSIVADIVLYVVIPTRRSTAQAFQILVSHALGDAISPYLIGLLSEEFKLSLTDPSIYTASEISKMRNATDYTSLELGLFTTCYVSILGGIFFFLNATYIIGDKRAADEFGCVVVGGINNKCVERDMNEGAAAAANSRTPSQVSGQGQGQGLENRPSIKVLHAKEGLVEQQPSPTPSLARAPAATATTTATQGYLPMTTSSEGEQLFMSKLVKLQSHLKTS